MIRRIALAGVVGAVSGVVAQAPLQWATGDRLSLLDADSQSLGTIWRGTVAHIDGLPPITTRLKGGKVDLYANGPTLKLAAAAAPNRIADLTMSVPVAALARFDSRLDGLSGEVAFALDEIFVEDGQCLDATGTAETDVLAVNAALWSWTGPVMTGPVTCEEGAIIADLAGQTDATTATARIRLDLTGPYATDMRVETSDTRAAMVLPLFGFQATGGAFVLSERGNWQ